MADCETMVRTIQDWFKKRSDGPDLFQYARGQEPKPARRRPSFLILIPILVAIAFLAGFWFGHKNSCDEERATIGALTQAPTASVDQPQFQSFIGTYRAEVSGHKAILYIYALQNGAPGATIHFQNWGNKIPEPLWNVAIQGNRIAFSRGCLGRRCQEIGAPGPFRQDYSGEINPDATQISGQYSGGQSGSGWTATRIR